MRTPYGQECQYFYGDYYRGKNHEECRLLGSEVSSSKWTPKLCKSCPVPSILQANACPNMILEGKIKQGFLNLNKNMQVSAFCTQTKTIVREPHVGCGSCHPFPDVFLKKDE